MTTNNYQWPTERRQTKKVSGMIEMDAISMLTTQVAALTKQLQHRNLSSQTMQFMIETRASIRSLETQLGKLATLMTNHAQGNLPSTTKVKSKEQCNAISLRSGKELKEPKVVDKEKEVTGSNQHINIPFSEALQQMPSYVKFMKEIFSKKRKLRYYETVTLTEECSAIIQEKLPPKLKDPGSFNIPCSIRGSVVTKALCDLGVSVNLFPLSIFQKLNLGEARPTNVSLQMVDKSIKHPRGVIGDVLVKVDKFIFPVDFIILDMEEDDNIPLILGRPFLATGRVLIDVQKAELKLQVQKEEVSTLDHELNAKRRGNGGKFEFLVVVRLKLLLKLCL
ncbi:uncharacterized protein LOC133800204 [Humulus lupulus]|uniref:uncharacterized protein LOC133800204 n=1 Tax=Humulus lupulus TaxID=3486 RepID=UPI002B4117A3|nr:uncharacterized protein LOC133800204 [Humulus lupulus]